MGYEEEEDERRELNSSHINWGEEPDPSWSGKEDCDFSSWKEETDSEISTYEAYERDEEPWNDETASVVISDEGENKLWYEETDSQISLEETKSHDKNSWSNEAEIEGSSDGDSEREEESKPWHEIPYSDHEEGHQGETDSQYSQEEIAEDKDVGSEARKYDFREAYTEEDEVFVEEDEDLIEEPRYINFSGHSQGPDAYTQWEKDMEEWFVSNDIFEKEKTTIAGETLTEDAFRHWYQDAFIRLADEVPDATWEEMKDIMRDEFVRDIYGMRQYYTKVYNSPNPTRWILACNAKTISAGSRNHVKKKCHKSLFFSGQGNDPNEYLRWENNMNQWLRANNIPNENKLSYVIDNLVGEAYKWWLKEATPTFYHMKQVKDWRDLKARMYKEFVEKHQTPNNNTTTFMCQAAPRSIKSTPKMLSTREHQYGLLPEPKPKRTCTPAQKEKTEPTPMPQAREGKPKSNLQTAVNKQSPSSMLERHSKLKQCKSSKLKELICYRCHKEGHFAATCPERHEINHASIEPKLSSPKTSNQIIELSLENSSSSIMLLSMPKVANTGHYKEKDIEEPVRNARLEEQHSKTIFQIQVSDSYECINYWKILVLTRSLKYTVLSTYVPDIMHLIFPLSFKERTGTNGGLRSTKGDSPEVKKVEDQIQNLSEPAPLVNTLLVMKRLRVPSTSLLKEEPPDAQRITKPPQHRGKTLNSQRRMKANLLSLGADCVVSRSKLCQQGGYDADIRITSYLEPTNPAPAKPPDDKANRTKDEEQQGSCSKTKSTRANDFSLNIHSVMAYFRNIARVIINLERSDFDLERSAHYRDENPRRACSRSNFTQAFNVSSCFHQETIYLKKIYRGKMALEQIKSRVASLALLEGLILPYRQLSLFGSLENHVWRPGLIIGDQEKCLHHLQKLKTHKDVPRNCTLFPYLGFVPMGFPRKVLMRQHP